jgi:hypothetical protein
VIRRKDLSFDPQLHRLIQLVPPTSNIRLGINAMNSSRSLPCAIVLLAMVHPASRAHAEISVALSAVATVDTRAAEVTAPASATIHSSPVNVTFLLPQPAQAGSVKLVFTGSVTRELTLATVHETAGTHNVSFDPGIPTGSASIAAGESLPDGTYSLTVAYRDGAGDAPVSNAATNLLIDHTAPDLTVPADIAVEATGDAGAIVNYPAASATDAIGVTSLTYSKASGTQFPIGISTVTVTAKDAANNTSVASFNITVNGVQIAVEQPAGTNLVDGAPGAIDFGPVAAGAGRTLDFTIRNHGTRDLTDLLVIKDASGTPGDFSISAPIAEILAPNAAATFSVTFSPTAPGVRTAILRIASNDPDENPFDINLTGSQATPFEAWRLTYFGSPGNTGVGADLNDPEGDGIVNLLEYATHSNPLVSTPSPGKLVKIGNVLEFTYTRPTAALQELIYSVETAASPAGPWSAVDPSATEILSDDGQLQQVKTTVSVDSLTRTFLRLRVTRQ